MKTQDKFRMLAVLIITGSLLFSLSTLATAESDAVRAIYISAANVPTNIPGIYTYAEPPKGFNPVAATDVELATYGFPPRPDKQAEPDHYALWERVVTAAKIRWNGELKPLPNTGHGMIPASSLRPDAVQSQTTTTGPKQISTINTSGVILTNTQTSWSKTRSFNVVYSNFSVPTVTFPYGVSCATAGYGLGTEEWSLVSIDGQFFNGQVEGSNPWFEPGLAGGVWEFPGAYTGSGNPCEPIGYLAVFGYFIPGWALEYGTFNPNPGDVFFAQVQASGPNNATVFLGDETTFTFAGYSVSTPGLVGQNAEWIVSRSCCSNPYNVYGTYPLANTVRVFFDDGAAGIDAGSSSAKWFYPGSQTSSTLILTMTDDKGDQNIETVNQGKNSGYEGQHALEFSTVNCAYSSGCTP